MKELWYRFLYVACYVVAAASAAAAVYLIQQGCSPVGAVVHTVVFLTLGWAIWTWRKPR